MRIYQIVILCVIIFTGAVCAGAETLPEHPELPYIEEWRCGETRTSEFEAVSGNQGYWQERDYITDTGVPLKATLLWGPGPRFFNQPPADTSGSAGQATYEITFIGGFKSTVEHDPVLGYSVAVNAFDRRFSLTVECGPHIDRAELLRCVEVLLEGME